MAGRLLSKILSFVVHIGADPNDTEDVRLQKTLLVFSSLMIGSLAIAWGSIYLAYGERLAATIPLSYTVLSYLSIAFFARTHRYRFFRASQLLFPLLLPFLLMIELGGFKNSSAVVLWSLTSPLGALFFVGLRQAVGWFLAFLGLVAAGAFLEPYIRPTNNLPPVLVNVFFVMNINCTSAVAFVLLQYFVGQKNTSLRLLKLEQKKSENLLLNILPKDIANILKNDNRTIADHYDGASILFADAVDFTPLSAHMTPVGLVDLLNDVFSYFDTLVEKYNLEKIKTIGDFYTVAAGVPHPRPDHAHALVRMALEMNNYVSHHDFHGHRLSFRIGINSGAVVAGVIGRKKFIYDLWGDAVNTASRMEAHGVGGKIQITQTTYELIKDSFMCAPRGKIHVKGKGDMNVWHVLEKRASALNTKGLGAGLDI